MIMFSASVSPSGLRRRHTTLLICVAISCLTLNHSAADDNALTFSDDVRRWRDHSGTHEVDAELVEYRDRQVTLRGTDGETIVVSLDQLSESDQKHVVARIRSARRMARQNAVRSGDDNTAIVQTSVLPTVNDEDATNSEGRAIKQLADSQPRAQQPRPVQPHNLFGVDWYSPQDALNLAAAERKPMMWFRVLGDLRGFM